MASFFRKQFKLKIEQQNKASIDRHTKIVEMLYTTLLVLFFGAYCVRFVFSGDNQPLALIALTYCILCLIVAVFLFRICASCLWQCNLTSYHQYVDLKILLRIMKDSVSIVIIVAGLLFVVVDLIVPRTPMSAADTGVLFVELLTVLFNDAQVNESRHFTMFHAIVMTLLIIALGIVGILGLEEDAPFFTINISGKYEHRNATNTPFEDQNQKQNGIVEYSRNEIKRLLYIQLVTVLIPSVFKIYNNPNRVKLVFVEKQVERWEIMDKKTVAYSNQKHMKAELKRLTAQLKLVMTVEKETEMRPQRLSGLGMELGLDETRFSTESPTSRRRGAVDIRNPFQISQIKDLQEVGDSKRDSKRGFSQLDSPRSSRSSSNGFASEKHAL